MSESKPRKDFSGKVHTGSGFFTRVAFTVTQREWPWLAVTGVFIVLRLHIILAAPLLGAEAYYWDWGQHPAWGYFDHPPGVAVMIRFTSALFGKTNLGVRFGSLVLGTALPILCRWIGGILYGRKAGRMAAFLTAGAPLVVVAGILATPDIPVTFFYLLALGAGILAVKRWSPVLFLITGLLTGVAILCKFNGFGLIIILGFLWFFRARGRSLGRAWYPVLGFAGLVLLIPYLQWNAEHDWVTFRYLFWERHKDAGASLINWTGPFELAGNFFTLGPVLGFLMLVVIYRWCRSRGTVEDRERRWIEFFVYFFPLAGFLLLSLKISMAPHWVGQILLTGVIVTSGWYLRRGPDIRGGRLLAVSAFVNILLCLVLYGIVTNLGGICRISARMGVPVRGEAVGEFFGWDEFAGALNEEISAVREEGKPVFIIAPHHRIASLARFHAEGNPYASVLYEDRLQQFEFWPRPSDMPGSNGVYVDKKYRERRIEEVRKQFRVVGEHRTLTIRVGECERTFHFWRLYDSKD